MIWSVGGSAPYMFGELSTFVGCVCLIGRKHFRFCRFSLRLHLNALSSPHPSYRGLQGG
jgi:hypothetical protein